jgi:hypothetical protein
MQRVPHPRVVRRALVALVSFSMLASPPLPGQAAPGKISLTPHQRLAREIYKELVEINTVDSVGSVTRAAGLFEL